jgi:hypothetical protein
MREPGHISETEMRKLLREAYSRDAEKSFLCQLVRSLCDPATARDAANRPRAHPLWLLLAAVALIMSFVFICFTFWNS